MFECSVTTLGEHAVTPGLSCHLLDICNTRLLLECPLDVSSFLNFLPAWSSGHGVTTAEGERTTKKQRWDASQPPRNQCVSPEDGLRYPYRLVQGCLMIDDEPWCKLPAIATLDSSSLDVVLISNPHTMLGLPYLMRKPNFSAQVYITEAAAKLGQLLMEDFVAMHGDYSAQFGRTTAMKRPSWLELSALQTLPPGFKSLLVGDKGQDSGSWHPIYSAADLKFCMSRLQRLRYGEVASIEGYLDITAVSSGLGVGAANWIIVGGGRKLAYLSGALMCENHSSGLDTAALSGSHCVLFAEVEPVSDLSLLRLEREPCSEIGDLPVENKTLVHTTLDARANSSGVKMSSGSAPRAGPTKPSPASSFRSALHAGAFHVKTHSHESVLPPVYSIKSSKQESPDSGHTSRQEFPVSEWKLRLNSICRATVDAASVGGSVLIPIAPSGVLMDLIEGISSLLSAVPAKVPIFYISPAAEEFLACMNTMPEWLCASRQEKLYAGESLFGHTDLLQDDRLRHFPSLSSTELHRCWQEPCIVFASHWNMRMGPAVDLLQRWQRNPLCLLISVEPQLDWQVFLAPYLPMAMKAMHLPMPCRLRPQEVASMMRSLPSSSGLVPAALREVFETLGSGTDIARAQYWQKGRTLRLDSLEQQQLTVEMPSDTAVERPAREMKVGKATAVQFRGELSWKDGKETLTPSNFQPKHRFQWGKANLEKLLASLQERGLRCVCRKDEAGVDHDGNRNMSVESCLSRRVIEITSPCHGWVELSSRETVIRLDDPASRLLITDALSVSIEG